MLEQTFEHLLETAMADLMAKQEQLSRDYGLGNMARWWLDQEAATVQFFDENDRLAVEGQIINIGSFSPRHGSWLWAWSNPTVLTALREKALPLKQLQAILALSVLVQNRPSSWKMSPWPGSWLPSRFTI